MHDAASPRVNRQGPLLVVVGLVLLGGCTQATDGPTGEPTAVSSGSTETTPGTKVGPPDLLMDVRVSTADGVREGNEWTVRVRRGHALRIAVIASLEPAAGGLLRLRLEGPNGTAATHVLTDAAQPGQERFEVRWPLRTSSGRLKAAQYQLFADLLAAGTEQSQGLGYIVITPDTKN